MTRVAVTTTVEGSEMVAEALAGHGLHPVLLPCISITPAPVEVLAQLRGEADSADMILVTSARAVWVTWPRGGMPQIPVAAVGAATAHAVESAGGGVTALGQAGAAELIGELEVAGKHIVFPHAMAADPATVEGLVSRGAAVTAMAVYETAPVAPGPDRVEAALFGSPLAVAGWSMSRSFEAMVVGAIGATTAAALRDHGVSEPVIPSRPGFSELARAMAESMGG